MTIDPSGNYHSYLLRLWRNSATGCWRASLQSTANGERLAFADVQSLIAFLVHQLETAGGKQDGATAHSGSKGEVVSPEGDKP